MCYVLGTLLLSLKELDTWDAKSLAGVVGLALMALVGYLDKSVAQAGEERKANSKIAASLRSKETNTALKTMLEEKNNGK